MTPQPVGNPIARSRPLGDLLADKLREQIIAGEIPAGTHLVEIDVAERFGVSRLPVRDALKQLLSEGLLESRRRGLSVVAMNERDVREVYDVRLAMESLAARTAIRRPDTDWEVLEQAQRDLEAHVEDSDRRHFVDADLEFHSALYLLAENRRLQSMWTILEPTMRTMLMMTNRRDSDLIAVSQAHRAILEAARRGDVEATERTLDAHITHARDLMVEALSDVWAQRPSS